MKRWMVVALVAVPVGLLAAWVPLGRNALTHAPAGQGRASGDAWVLGDPAGDGLSVRIEWHMGPALARWLSILETEWELGTWP